MIELKIEGMSCGHCKAAVEKALTGVQGVDRFEVNLEAGRAVIEGSATAEALIAAVADAGYEAVQA
ncbi:MAG: heavy metal-binding protein [Gammaproteobacteria bacterium]|nr:heavy metal-binding protein [Gammaproteobacteria bacterium]